MISILKHTQLHPMSLKYLYVIPLQKGRPNPSEGPEAPHESTLSQKEHKVER